MEKVSHEGLVRGIRRWDLIAIAINGIIGAGIFGLPAYVFARLGAYSLVAFVACALVVALIILCFAEVGSRFNETGGPYLYAREAFGPMTAFQVGWLVWLARITAFAANCNLLVSYLGYFWSGATGDFWRAAIIIVVVIALTFVNVIGVREATLASNIFTVGKLLPLLVFIAIGLFFIAPANFHTSTTLAYAPFSQSVLKLVYAFTGFEMAAIPAGEMRDPRRHLPRALIIAIAVVAFVYILIQVVCIGTLPGLATSTTPLADSASRFLGAAGGALISAGALISIIGNLNILILSGSRVPFAMAEQEQLPGIVARIHPRSFTPYISVIVTASVMLLLTLMSSFVAALTISAIARLVTYSVTCLALIVFRQRSTAPEAKFRLPGGAIIAVVALGLAMWLLSNVTWDEARATLIALLVGLAICVGYKQVRRLRSRAVAQHQKLSGEKIIR